MARCRSKDADVESTGQLNFPNGRTIMHPPFISGGRDVHCPDTDVNVRSKRGTIGNLIFFFFFKIFQSRRFLSTKFGVKMKFLKTYWLEGKGRLKSECPLFWSDKRRESEFNERKR